jgi:hypothetical protein
VYPVFIRIGTAAAGPTGKHFRLADDRVLRDGQAVHRVRNDNFGDQAAGARANNTATVMNAAKISPATMPRYQRLCPPLVCFAVHQKNITPRSLFGILNARVAGALAMRHDDFDRFA